MTPPRSSEAEARSAGTFTITTPFGFTWRLRLCGIVAYRMFHSLRR